MDRSHRFVGEPGDEPPVVPSPVEPRDDRDLAAANDGPSALRGTRRGAFGLGLHGVPSTWVAWGVGAALASEGSVRRRRASADIRCQAVRHEGVQVQQVKVLSEQSTVRLGSYQAVSAGDGARRSPGTNGRLGRSAKPQAAMRVNPEQASKALMRKPTRQPGEEGRCAAEKKPSRASVVIRRGSGSGMWGRIWTQRGRPGDVRGSCPQRAARARRPRESEGLVVPAMPWKHGGGKEPCFWVQPKERRIGGLA